MSTRRIPSPAAGSSVAPSLGTSLASLAVLSLFTALSASGCAADLAALDEDAGDFESEPSGEAGALTSSVDCHVRTDTAYVSGSPRSIKLITIGGKPTSIAVGHQFLKMQKAADAAGVSLAISSGFRTMAEQQHFYDCYKTKRCNNGNLAAKPGYSNHQSGYALDLTTSSWLARNASRFGFRRTVPSEAWHYEYHGPDTGGPCSPGGAGGSDSDSDEHASGGAVTCTSATLGERVPAGTCVHRTDSDKWFVCDAEAPNDWPEVTGSSDDACKTCPQLSGGACD
jgi:hypothetical protein